MALKSLLFVCLLVFALAVITAKAQSLPSNITSINVNGTLYCTSNGNINTNGTTPPVFPGALVGVQCGPTVLATARTNATGFFKILVDLVQFFRFSLQTKCNLFVGTSLTTCNSSLSANGTLVSDLEILGITSDGILILTAKNFTLIIKA